MDTNARPDRGEHRAVPPVILSWIGWGAMAIAILLYGGIGAVLAKRQTAGAAAELPTWMLPTLAALSGCAAVLLHAHLRRAGAEAPDGLISRPVVPAAPGRWFVVWALDEAVAVIGLVALLIGGSARGFGLYLAAAFALLVLHRPRR